MKCSLTGICLCPLCTMVKIPYLVQKLWGVCVTIWFKYLKRLPKYIKVCFSDKFWFLQIRYWIGWCSLVQFNLSSKKKSWDGFHFKYNIMWAWHYYFVISTKVGPNPKEHLSGLVSYLATKTWYGLLSSHLWNVRMGSLYGRNLFISWL